MQRTYLTPLMIVAIMTSLTTVGCTKSKGQGSAPSQQPELRQNRPAWTLTLRSNCADSAEEECVAKYGFKVAADGSYELGPAPQGQVLSGKLSEEEFQSLNTVVANASVASAPDAARAESCADLGEEAEQPASEDSVILTRSDQEVTLYRTEATRTCFQTASRESAEQLHHAIRALADKYYVLPFPDACAEAANSVMALYPAMQSCATDNDCAYVDLDYGVIPSESAEFVITDTCSKVQPMIVGNAKTIVSEQLNLLEALSQAQSVCGGRILRDSCDAIAGFQSSVGAPVCQQGVCRAHPSATALR